MRSIKYLSLIAFVLTFAGCSKEDDTSDDFPEFELNKPDAFPDEDYELYSLFLEQYAVKTVVVQQETQASTAFYLDGSTWFQDDLAEQFPDYDTNLLQKQVAINETSKFLDRDFDVADKTVYLITEEELDYIEEKGNENPDPGYIPFWNYFYKVHPNSQGYVSLSLISYNETQDQALFEYLNACGGLCGEGGFVYFRKENGSWKLIETFLLIIS